MKRKTILLLMLLLYGSVNYAQYTAIKFYVVSHGEDWQAFMGKNAYRDMKANNKVVVINVTAGNWFTSYLSGCCTDFCPGTTYWHATERAELNSVDFTVNNISDYHNYGGPRIWRNINGHNISTYTNKNVTVYFLRLDEGALDAWNSSGGTSGGFWAVDGSAAYSSYFDLATTVTEIYRYEIHASSFSYIAPDINTFDYDPAYNPGDHSIHYFTGFLAVDGVYYYCHSIPCYIKLYQGFHLQSMPVNLANDEWNHEVQDKSAIYAVYSLGMMDNNAQVLWNGFPTWGYNATNDFLHKEYLRSYHEPSGVYCGYKMADPSGHHNYHSAYVSAAEMSPWESLENIGNGSITHPLDMQSDVNKSMENRIKVYPNPANDKISCLLGGSYNSALTFKIVDVTGRVVYREDNVTVNSVGNLDINTSAIVNGTYLLTISNDKNLLFKKKIIIYHSSN